MIRSSSMILLAALLACGEPAANRPALVVENADIPATKDLPAVTVERPSFRCGTVRVGLREPRVHARFDDHDHEISLVVSERKVMDIRFRGGIAGVGDGMPFKGLDGQPPRLVIDKNAGTITWSKPYALAAGATAIFSYQLSALDGGKVRLSWDTGHEQQKAIRGELALSAGYREAGLRMDGTAITLAELPVIMAKNYYEPTQVWKGDVTRIDVGKLPAGLVFTTPTTCFASECKVGDATELLVKVGLQGSGSLTIDCTQTP